MSTDPRCDYTGHPVHEDNIVVIETKPDGDEVRWYCCPHCAETAWATIAAKVEQYGAD